MQFGRQLAEFQGVAIQMADVYVDLADGRRSPPRR